MILASPSLGWAWRGYSKRHSDSPEPGMQGLYWFISNQSVKYEAKKKEIECQNIKAWDLILHAVRGNKVFKKEMVQ